jgi:UDP-glucuronate 4-epimerase
VGLQGAKVLVTGAAGFIGYHTCQQLLAAGATVCGIDNFSPYYDVRLKEDRAARLLAQPGFALHRLSIQDMDALRTVWTDFAPGIVIHLAAQPGVRYSIDHPREYIDTNVVGTFNLLELARHHPVEHLLISSTSSVYGANTDIPFDEGQAIQKPVSLYAATKGATELIGHSYSHLFAIPATYFRFFTVYGPWGRPDMAPFKFTDAIAAGRAIDVYNNGDMARDFTFVDDLVAAILGLAKAVPGKTRVAGDSLSPVAPFRVVNIGGGRQTRLLDFIAEIERALGKPAIKNMMPMQAGDVEVTEASNHLLRALIGRVPETPPSMGVPQFVAWYRDYYGDRLR